MELKKFIRDVPDFPKPGIMFKDITPLLADPAAFREAVDGLCDLFAGERLDGVCALESRGFIFGAPVALSLGVPFIPLRKPGKLPRKTDRVFYALEYGQDSMEVHEEDIVKGGRYLVIDDVIATGGTARAAADLILKCGGEVVGIAVLIELTFLDGRKKLGDFPTRVLLTY